MVQAHSAIKFSSSKVPRLRDKCRLTSLGDLNTRQDSTREEYGHVELAIKKAKGENMLHVQDLL